MMHQLGSMIEATTMNDNVNGAPGGAGAEPRQTTSAPPSSFVDVLAVGGTGCQVPGCSHTINSSVYFSRHKICPAHYKMESLVLCGTRIRFCQQCAHFHPVGEFDNQRRSCRDALKAHNERRRKRAHAVAAAAAAAAAGGGAPGGPHPAAARAKAGKAGGKRAGSASAAAALACNGSSDGAATTTSDGASADDGRDSSSGRAATSSAQQQQQQQQREQQQDHVWELLHDDAAAFNSNLGMAAVTAAAGIAAAAAGNGAAGTLNGVHGSSRHASAAAGGAASGEHGGVSGSKRSSSFLMAGFLDSCSSLPSGGGRTSATPARSGSPTSSTSGGRYSSSRVQRRRVTPPAADDAAQHHAQQQQQQQQPHAGSVGAAGNREVSSSRPLLAAGAALSGPACQLQAAAAGALASGLEAWVHEEQLKQQQQQLMAASASMAGALYGGSPDSCAGGAAGASPALTAAAAGGGATLPQARRQACSSLGGAAGSGGADAAAMARAQHNIAALAQVEMQLLAVRERLLRIEQHKLQQQQQQLQQQPELHGSLPGGLFGMAGSIAGGATPAAGPAAVAAPAPPAPAAAQAVTASAAALSLPGPLSVGDLMEEDDLALELMLEAALQADMAASSSQLLSTHGHHAAAPSHGNDSCLLPPASAPLAASWVPVAASAAPGSNGLSLSTAEAAAMFAASAPAPASTPAPAATMLDTSMLGGCARIMSSGLLPPASSGMQVAGPLGGLPGFGLGGNGSPPPAAASGAAPAAAAAAAAALGSYQPQQLLARLSLKLYGTTPDQLPAATLLRLLHGVNHASASQVADLRALSTLLGASLGLGPESTLDAHSLLTVQAGIRAGCVMLEVDVAVSRRTYLAAAAHACLELGSDASTAGGSDSAAAAAAPIAAEVLGECEVLAAAGCRAGPAAVRQAAAEAALAAALPLEQLLALLGLRQQLGGPSTREAGWPASVTAIAGAVGPAAAWAAKGRRAVEWGVVLGRGGSAGPGEAAAGTQQQPRNSSGTPELLSVAPMVVCLPPGDGARQQTLSLQVTGQLLLPQPAGAAQADGVFVRQGAAYLPARVAHVSPRVAASGAVTAMLEVVLPPHVGAALLLVSAERPRAAAAAQAAPITTSSSDIDGEDEAHEAPSGADAVPCVSRQVLPVLVVGCPAVAAELSSAEQVAAASAADNPDAPVAVRQLLSELGLVLQAAAARSAGTLSSEQQTEQWTAALMSSARGLLQHAVLSGWPATAGLLMQLILTCQPDGVATVSDLLAWAPYTRLPAIVQLEDRLNAITEQAASAVAARRQQQQQQQQQGQSGSSSSSWNLLHLAVASGNVDMLQALLQQLVTSSSSSSSSAPADTGTLAEWLRAPGPHGTTVLHLAAAVAGSSPGMCGALLGSSLAACALWLADKAAGASPADVARAVTAAAGNAAAGEQLMASAALRLCVGLAAAASSAAGGPAAEITPSAGSSLASASGAAASASAAVAVGGGSRSTAAQAVVAAQQQQQQQQGGGAAADEPELLKELREISRRKQEDMERWEQEEQQALLAGTAPKPLLPALPGGKDGSKRGALGDDDAPRQPARWEAGLSAASHALLGRPASRAEAVMAGCFVLAFAAASVLCMALVAARFGVSASIPSGGGAASMLRHAAAASMRQLTAACALVVLAVSCCLSSLRQQQLRGEAGDGAARGHDNLPLAASAARALTKVMAEPRLALLLPLCVLAVPNMLLLPLVLLALALSLNAPGVPVGSALAVGDAA